MAADPVHKPLLITSRAVDGICARPNSDGVFAVLSSRIDGNVWDGEIRVLNSSAPASPIFQTPLKDSAAALAWHGEDRLVVGNDLGVLQVWQAPAKATVGVEITLQSLCQAHDNVISSVATAQSDAVHIVSASWDRRYALHFYHKEPFELFPSINIPLSVQYCLVGCDTPRY
jgi:WD40 repeat protein